MIGTVAHIMTTQRIEQGAPPAVVARALARANSILQDIISPAHYAELDAMADDDPARSGGIIDGAFFEGVNNIIGDEVFAILAYDASLVITGFGTVKKMDEYSEHAEYYQVAKAKEANFYKGIRTLCNLKGWTYIQPSATMYTTQMFRK